MSFSRGKRMLSVPPGVPVSRTRPTPVPRPLPAAFEEALTQAGYWKKSDQKELAEACGASWWTFLKWKRDAMKYPNASTERVVEKLAPKLKLKPWELIGILRRK